MSRYVVELRSSARKQVAAIRDRHLRGQIEAAILGLGDDPRPLGVRKMVGNRDEWRIRVRDWRVVYRIKDGRLVVLMVSVAKRDEVYR